MGNTAQERELAGLIEHCDVIVCVASSSRRPTTAVFEMVLKKQDSGVCLTTETTHSDVAEVSPAVAFYVDTGGQPSSAGDASATRRQTPTRSSAGLPPTSPRHADRLEETRSGQLSPRSASSPRTAFGMPGRPQEEPRSAGTRKTVGQKLQGALPKALTKVIRDDVYGSLSVYT